MTDYSIVVPIYGNEANIADLLAAVQDISGQLDGELQVVFVVDGSPDNSYQHLRDGIPGLGINAVLLSHAKNFGSFNAIRTGLQHADGKYTAIMSADLQEPPELILKLFSVLVADQADVAFGQRNARGDPWLDSLLAKLFWTIYRHLVFPDIPSGGVDIFACNRLVLQSVLDIQEQHGSLIGQLFWIGCRRHFVRYRRRARNKGESAWTLAKKIKYMADSIFSYSDLPIFLLFGTGFIGLLISLGWGCVVLAAKLWGSIEVPGYAAQMMMMLFLFSLMFIGQGVLGGYIWRTFENSKRRPLSIVARKEVFDGKRQRSISH